MALAAKSAQSLQQEIRAPALKVQGSRFVREGGQPFRWIGASAFTLALKSDREIERFVEEQHQRGVTVLRVLTMAPDLTAGRLFPFDGTPGHSRFALNPAHSARIDRILDACARRNMVVELVLLADIVTAFDPRGFPAITQYVTAVASRLKDRPNVVIEVANEFDHPLNQLTVPQITHLAELYEQIDPRRPLAGSSGSGWDTPFAGAPFDYVTVHTPRDRPDRWFLEQWQLRDLRGLGKPIVSDEPMGAAEGSEYRRSYEVRQDFRETGASRVRAALWIATLAGASFTLHSHKGIWAKSGPTPGAQSLAAYARLLGDWDATAASPKAAGEPGAWIAKLSGVEAAFLSQSADRAFVYVWSVASGATLVFEGSASVEGTLYDPASARELGRLAAVGGQPAPIPGPRDDLVLAISRHADAGPKRP